MTWAINGSDRCDYGQRRLDYAKIAVSRATMSLPDTTPIGMIFLPYHDPWTPSLVLPLLNGNKQKALSMIKEVDAVWCPYSPVGSFQATGGTPLAMAIHLAGQVVAQTGGARVVVLTDGVDTCGGDPVAVAARIRAQGIPVELHIIGFTVDPFERTVLTNTAHVCGGQYYHAANAGELQAAVGTATRLLSGRQ